MRTVCTHIIKFSLSILGLALLLGFVASCNKAEETKPSELSPEAKKAITEAIAMNNSYKNARSVVYLDSVYATLKNPSTKDLFEKYSFKISYYLFVVKQDTIKAKSYIDSMFYLLKEKEQFNRYEFARAIFTKGDLEIAKKNYDKAFEYYYSAHQYALKYLDQCQNFQFSIRVGVLKLERERYKEAIPYLRQALEQNERCNEKDVKMIKQGYLNSLSLCYERSNQLDSALYYYQKTISAIDRESSAGLYSANYAQVAKGIVYGNMGGVYANLGRFNEAEKYLRQSIAINDRPSHDSIDAQTAKLKLAALYLRQSRLNDTYALLAQLQQTLEQNGPVIGMSTKSQLRLYELQRQYFDKIKDESNAYLYAQKYYLLRDSLTEASEKNRITDIDNALKEHAQHDKLTLLAKDNEIKRNYIIGFIIFLAMALGILLLVWRNHRKLRALNSEITTQNIVMQKVLNALEKSQEENTRMMKIVAHDLRSPIAATLSIAELLKMANLSAADLEMLTLLEVTNQQCLDMIGNLLSINAKTDELTLTSVRMHMFLKHSVNLFKFKASEKKQKIKLHVHDIEVQIDGGKIWRVFSNLIANAIKFSPQGSTIQVNLQEKPESIVVSVSDEGIGIPEEIKCTIFNIFTEARRQGTSGEHSFGLGLAISKQIVEAHHGQIWVESEVGKGSTFFVELAKG